MHTGCYLCALGKDFSLCISYSQPAGDNKKCVCFHILKVRNFELLHKVFLALTTPATCDRKPNTFAISSFLASCSSTMLCSPYPAEQATGIFVMCDDSSLNWSTRPKHWLWKHVHLPSLRWCTTEIDRIAHFVNQTCLMNWAFYLCMTYFSGESFQGQQIMKSWDFSSSCLSSHAKKNQL